MCTVAAGGGKCAINKFGRAVRAFTKKAATEDGKGSNNAARFKRQKAMSKRMGTGETIIMP